MTLNVANQRFSDPDPVVQLRERFNTFRTNLRNAPDAIESRAVFSHHHLVAGAVIPAFVEIYSQDWRGEPASLTITSTVEHDPRGSDGLCTIGPVVNTGTARYRFSLTAASGPGVDHFLVRLFETTRSRIMMPSPEIRVLQAGDMNGDGRLNNFDIDAFVMAMNAPETYASQYPDLEPALLGDCNFDGVFNSFDIDAFVEGLSR
jgi:phosphatidylserine/phosphatidylglycerophosphate/cardiolipin synthase-like enzyme